MVNFIIGVIVGVFLGCIISRPKREPDELEEAMKDLDKVLDSRRRRK